MTNEEDLKNLEIDGNTFALKVGLFAIALLSVVIYGVYYIGRAVINDIL